ncbi:hypothetical protein [uncultured Agrobacterium sp.]|uniref:hypothetical protein n=1 Tax=uncultured Agrobacterium sp. TaxID=157277 RepID=UPI0025EEE463|nr:hypothetical protein [uncultured Agrobacterium sp.]
MTDDASTHAAALAYVRECGRQLQIVAIDEFAEKHGIAADALRDEVARGIAVVGAWQCGEVSGAIARQLIGARSYGDLYRILRNNQLPVSFKPGDVATWAADGKIQRAEVGEIMGIQDTEIDAFIVAWTAANEG